MNEWIEEEGHQDYLTNKGKSDPTKLLHSTECALYDLMQLVN